jgi:hypothetical protein
MASTLSTAASVDRAARTFQSHVLTECAKALRRCESEFWIFVHLRSIALKRDGRVSGWTTVGYRPTVYEETQVDNALVSQYRLEPNLRTYNELLISRDQGSGIQRVSFSFGRHAQRADIHFDDLAIAAATQNLTFTRICNNKSGKINEQSRKKLAECRLSLGLDEVVQSKFNLSVYQPANRLKALPDEVRYSLQVLMLWSNTLKWKYIETFHSPTRFDALSGLVITVASRERKLDQDSIRLIDGIFQKRHDEIDRVVAKKTDLLPRLATRPLPGNLDTRLSIRSPRDERLWDGRDVFHVIEHIRNQLFPTTFEGVPESYCFILGHPGFIARPKELEGSAFITVENIRQYRERCEGALDTLNVIDVLGQPQKRVSKFCLVPIALPVWAKNWEDAEQAFGSSLEVLSFVHRDMIVIGLMCRNVIMVYKDGELVCVFNGAWHEVLPWTVMAKKLGIPPELASQSRITQIYRLLTRIAYGPLPRSVIVGYASNRKAFERFRSAIHPFGEDFGKWPPLEPEDPVEPVLMRATKTDGAIFAYTETDKSLFLLGRARVISEQPKAAKRKAASGTGDATAQAMASKGNGIVSIKVSRDGGLKVRWNGNGPVKGAEPIENY